MDLSALKEAFRAHLQAALGCPVRWSTKADFAGVDGSVSPSTLAYIRITSAETLGKYDEERWEGDKLRTYEHTLTKNRVTVMVESADGRDNFDAFFYARKGENVLRRKEVTHPANVAQFDVLPVSVREGPALEDNGETLSTAVLEVVWSYEQITASGPEATRLIGPGLLDGSIIEEIEEPGKTEDLATDAAALTLSGTCELTS